MRADRWSGGGDGRGEKGAEGLLLVATSASPTLEKRSGPRGVIALRALPAGDRIPTGRCLLDRGYERSGRFVTVGPNILRKFSWGVGDGSWVPGAGPSHTRRSQDWRATVPRAPRRRSRGGHDVAKREPVLTQSNGPRKAQFWRVSVRRSWANVSVLGSGGSRQRSAKGGPQLQELIEDERSVSLGGLWRRRARRPCGTPRRPVSGRRSW